MVAKGNTSFWYSPFLSFLLPVQLGLSCVLFRGLCSPGGQICVETAVFWFWSISSTFGYSGLDCPEANQVCLVSLLVGRPGLVHIVVWAEGEKQDSFRNRTHFPLQGDRGLIVRSLLRSLLETHFIIMGLLQEGRLAILIHRKVFN